MHRASPAKCHAAAKFSAFQANNISDNPQHRGIGFGFNGRFFTVDGECVFSHFFIFLNEDFARIFDFRKALLVDNQYFIYLIGRFPILIDYALSELLKVKTRLSKH
jgi:hypothetical protein